MNLERTISLIGKDKIELINKLHILIVGIGGVGGYTLESLVRMGVDNITIADYDVIDGTNINRQILATNNNVGILKTEEAYSRYMSINPNLNLKLINEKISEDNTTNLLQDKYDYIVDACDDTLAKVSLIKYALINNIKIISSCGTAKRIDASKLYITTLDKTENDPLARKLRSILRKENLSLKIPVVCSKELPIETNLLGSVSYVPAVAGLLITSYIINDILK